MAKLKGYTLDIGYPVYGAKFVNNKTLIVAGGGGEGKNGVPNKLTAILVQPDHKKKPLKRYRELLLNEEEDCPMSLDVNSNVILMGVNENSEMIKRGVNKHLRKFKFVNDHLKFVESCQIHPEANPQQYQKITCLSNDGSLGVIAMSDNPSSIYIVDTSEDLEERFKIVTNGDVKDVNISPDGKLMCYITSSHLEAISTITGRSVFKTDIDFHMTKVSFYDNNIVVIAGSDKSGIVVAHYSIAKSQVVKKSIVYRNLKGVTSMDVNHTNGLIALSGSDCSLMLVRFKDLKLLKKVNKVHNFAITKVTSSEDGHYIASVSAADTVSVMIVPPKFSESKSLFLSLFEFLLSILLVVVFGALMQFLYAHGYIDMAKQKVVDFYRSHRPADSSSYFTIQPIGSSETFTKGSPSTTTYLPDDATIKSDIISLGKSEDSITTVTPLTEITTSTPVSLVPEASTMIKDELKKRGETVESNSESIAAAGSTVSITSIGYTKGTVSEGELEDITSEDISTTSSETTVSEERTSDSDLSSSSETSDKLYSQSEVTKITAITDTTTVSSITSEIEVTATTKTEIQSSGEPTVLRGVSSDGISSIVDNPNSSTSSPSSAIPTDSKGASIQKGTATVSNSSVLLPTDDEKKLASFTAEHKTTTEQGSIAATSETADVEVESSDASTRSASTEVFKSPSKILSPSTEKTHPEASEHVSKVTSVPDVTSSEVEASEVKTASTSSLIEKETVRETVTKVETSVLVKTSVETSIETSVETSIKTSVETSLATEIQTVTERLTVTQVLSVTASPSEKESTTTEGISASISIPSSSATSNPAIEQISIATAVGQSESDTTMNSDVEKKSLPSSSSSISKKDKAELSSIISSSATSQSVTSESSQMTSESFTTQSLTPLTSSTESKDTVSSTRPTSSDQSSSTSFSVPSASSSTSAFVSSETSALVSSDEVSTGL